MLNIQDIPYDAGIDKDNTEIYDGDGYLSYGYFGNCRTTVPSVWNATQMSGFIRTCKIIPVSKVCNKIYDGDRKLPKKLIKGI